MCIYKISFQWIFFLFKARLSVGEKIYPPSMNVIAKKIHARILEVFSSMIWSIFRLPDANLVPPLWEWLTLSDYIFLLKSVGRKELLHVQCLQERYSVLFRKFLLSDKNTILASRLWKSILSKTFTCKDTVKNTVLLLDIEACLGGKSTSKNFEKCLSVVKNFENIRFKSTSFCHSDLIATFTTKLMANCFNILKLDVSGVATFGFEANLVHFKNLDDLTIECSGRRALQSIIVHCRKIRCLTLKGQHLTDRDLSLFGFHVHKLSEYSTNAKNHSNMSLSVLLHHCGSKLKSLKLDRIRSVTEAFAVSLEGACPIEYLSLSLCDNIGDLGVILSQMPKLQVFNCSGNNSVTHSELIILLMRCVHIRELHFETIRPSLKQNMSFRIGCTNLASVRLSNCNLSDEILLSLVTDKTGSQFTTLDISKNPDLSDRALYDAVGCLSNVTNLNISCCSRVTGDVLEILAMVCLKLTVLNVSECSRVTEKGIIAVLKGCSCLTTLLMEFLVNCNTERVIDHIVDNKLTIRKFRASNGTRENNETLVNRLQENIPSVEAFIRPSAPVENFALCERVSFKPPITVFVEKLDYCDDEY